MALTGYPDGQPKSFPNQFASNFTSTGLIGFNFGFNAGLIKIIIDGGGPAYIDLTGTGGHAGAQTTNGYRLSSADLLTDWYNVGVPHAGMALSATSTSLTGRVGAWG